MNENPYADEGLRKAWNLGYMAGKADALDQTQREVKQDNDVIDREIIKRLENLREAFIEQEVPKPWLCEMEQQQFEQLWKHRNFNTARVVNGESEVPQDIAHLKIMGKYRDIWIVQNGAV